jgi:hypothetical protein
LSRSVVFRESNDEDLSRELGEVEWFAGELQGLRIVVDDLDSCAIPRILLSVKIDAAEFYAFVVGSPREQRPIRLQFERESNFEAVQWVFGEINIDKFASVVRAFDRDEWLCTCVSELSDLLFIVLDGERAYSCQLVEQSLPVCEAHIFLIVVGVFDEHEVIRVLIDAVDGAAGTCIWGLLDLDERVVVLFDFCLVDLVGDSLYHIKELLFVGHLNHLQLTLEDVLHVQHRCLDQLGVLSRKVTQCLKVPRCRNEDAQCRC